MKLKRPNKKLEEQIKQAIKNLKCPVHAKHASISMDDEEAEVQVEACCVFFKQDVFTIGERMRKDFLYRDQKTRERLDREWKKSKGRNND